MLAIWLYIAGSIGLLLAVHQLRCYPVYLLKWLWVSFTLVAFTWVVMMSGASNAEFIQRPTGCFSVLAGYPQRFAETYRLDIWMFALLGWPALFLLQRWPVLSKRTRLATRLCLALHGLLLLLPLLQLLLRFDWATYNHFAENYRHAWRIARMGDYFLNSVLVALSTVGLVTLLGAMAAYALSRLRFAGRRPLTVAIIGAMAVPGTLLMIPLFLSLQSWSTGDFSFANSRFGLSVIYCALSLPFTVFLLGAFYRTLPSELAQAAVIDGASSWRVFSQVYFPLSAPALATTAIFNFLGVWNEYHFALVFLTNADFRTLPVGLYNLHVSQQYAHNFPALFAGIVIVVLPTFLIFMLLQERIVAGLTVGSLKG